MVNVWEPGQDFITIRHPGLGSRADTNFKTQDTDGQEREVILLVGGCCKRI